MPALNARAIKPDQAIDMLERLRFRWRGDALEMKTLRKLAGLYFAKQLWRGPEDPAGRDPEFPGQ